MFIKKYMFIFRFDIQNYLNLNRMLIYHNSLIIIHNIYILLFFKN
jgi:hypothetical protein